MSLTVVKGLQSEIFVPVTPPPVCCLLYTSDAADE